MTLGKLLYYSNEFAPCVSAVLINLTKNFVR